MIGLCKSLPWRHPRAGVAVALLAAVSASGARVRAAELSAADVAVKPGHVTEVVVSGSIHGESTFGLTVLVELVPREGSVGRVVFTPQEVSTFAEPEVFTSEAGPFAEASVYVQETKASQGDIQQRGDVWPEIGSFSAFDTARSGSGDLNGVVDDNGTFLPEHTRFFGPLASMPVIASSDADGIWDVRLSTRAGDSRWEGVATRLVAGTITVSPSACAGDSDCGLSAGGSPGNCSAGVCHYHDSESDFEPAVPGSAGRSRRSKTALRKVEP
jgi:hypothetical protein